MFKQTVIGLITTLGIASAAFGADIKVLAPNAAKEAVTEAVTVFEKTSGDRVILSWTGTEAITKRVAEGEAVDVVVNAGQNIERLSKDGKLLGPTRTDFARSGIGIAVPASAAKLDVSTAEKLKQVLLAARTVVVSSGTSGRHMVETFGKLGIADQLKVKTKQPLSGAQISDLLSSGEGDVGFQQVSELMHAKGIQYLGPLPADLQNYTVYSAAAHAGSTNLEAANALLAALRAPSTAAVIRASGMEPIQ